MESDSLSIETLVKTVARAFYDDTAVLILDTLLREKFVPDDEIRLRLKLPRNEKDEIGKTLTQLEKEMLIKFESVTIEERGRAKKCYYIDYQTFFSVVRYRMHLMVAILKERKKETKTNYQCPTCHATFNELDVERYRAKDMYFVCRSCCPDDFRDIDSEPAFRLRPMDNRKKCKAAELLEMKFWSQLGRRRSGDSSSTQLCHSITEILDYLDDKQLSRNLPSENYRRKIGPSRDAEIEKEYEKEDGANPKKKQKSGLDEVSVPTMADDEESGWQLAGGRGLVNGGEGVLSGADVAADDVKWEDDD